MNLLLISNSTQFGGGYLEHCRDALVTLFGPAPRRLLFVPFALADHDAYAAKASAAFVAMGYVCRSLHEFRDPTAALADADGIFVGGGNTFRLLDQLQRRGLVDPLRARVRDGMPYAGASAGTNVACPTIRTTNDMPIVMPASFTALALVPFQINPHYLDPDPGSRHMGETREQRIREFHEENHAAVLGLREGGMLRIEGGSATLLGPHAMRLFRRGENPREIAPGTSLSFLL
ncbi:MAG: dipeptidase PepE [Planctomycetes bacterium]|nr:dipeptidase PepE [Planctomycetota bacterium]